MPQVWRQHRRFLRVLVHIGDNLTKVRIRDFPFFAFFEEAVVTHVGHELAHVDEVIDAAFHVCHSRLACMRHNTLYMIRYTLNIDY
jgi:hypothetical protein